MTKCININHPDYIDLLQQSGLHEDILKAKISIWMDENGVDRFPTTDELGISIEKTYQLVANDKIDEQIASEKTIRDLASRLSDRIGIPVKFISDRSKPFKGKLRKSLGGWDGLNLSINDVVAEINLAYATLDTPIHEILGHPIIRAIKNKQQEDGKSITKEEFERETKNNTPSYSSDTISEFIIDNYIYRKVGSEYTKGRDIEKPSDLYQNLLKELETGRGKEVLDRIKRDYNKKFERGKSFTFEGKDYIADTASKTGYRDKYGDDVDSNELETALFAYELKHKDEVYYTLEEQQEEAIVELLGLMTAEKLDNVKDGKLISLLKRLLKEMKAFVRQLLGQNEVEIDKLPDDMTLGDIADILSYSNSKLILPGYEVIYTTPDNQEFKTYAEASKYISELAKNVKDVSLDDISLNIKLSDKELEEIKKLEQEKQEKENYFNSNEYKKDKVQNLQNLNNELKLLKNKKVEFKSQEPNLDNTDKNKYGFQEYDYVRVESIYSRPEIFGETLWQKEFGKDFEGYYIHGYNTDNTKPSTKVLKITKEEAETIWKKEVKKYPLQIFEVNDRQDIYRLEDKIRNIEQDGDIKYQIQKLKDKIEKSKIGDNSIAGFLEKNKEYEQSKEIIEEWKKVNNIQYNPEEVYSRGQEFVSVVGAYSDFDINLMMQNLLHHIEDNQKAGGEFTVSAFTKPIDRTIGHLEGGGGKIKFKIYPQSQDIKWASNTDVYSGSVWDASKKVSKGKKSELLGVSYSKYPNINNVSKIQPNLASIIDDIAHYHNELGITLTGKNFRLEYDDNIPYSTKKIIDSINSILDQKYGKLIKPKISKKVLKSEKVYEVRWKTGGVITRTTDLNEAKAKMRDKYIDSQGNEVNPEDVVELVEGNPIEQIGIQPTQTNESLKESIESVKDKKIQEYEYTLNPITKEKYDKAVEKSYADSKGIIGEFTEDGETYYVDINDTVRYRRSAEGYFEELATLKPKEYTSQALINTKIAKLKEAAKKYPRSLIRSEVVPIKTQGSNIRTSSFEDEDLSFQKVPSEKLLDNLQFKKGDC